MQAIIDAMREVSESWDPEAAHSKADSLLVEALNFLSMETEFNEEIDAILEYYRTITKWLSLIHI